MEPIDRKFIFVGYNPVNGKVVTQDNAVIFRAKDIAFLRTLPTYIDKAIEAGADDNFVEGMKSMMERVARYQEDVLSQVPDTQGDEIKRCIEGDLVNTDKKIHV